MMSKITGSPVWVCVVPFLVFVGLAGLQGVFGETKRYWLYLVKSVVGATLIWAWRRFLPEMRWRLTWDAVVVGVAVFGMWVGLDGFYPRLAELGVKLGLSQAKSAAEQAAAVWNPHVHFGPGAALAWFFVGVRILGSSLVVPPVEEVFFRSFLYRYIARADFLSVPLGQFAWKPFLVTALIFGLEHNEWLAGILCGFAYQGLVCWKGRLEDAITAHAITNGLLGLWVVGRGAWHFW